MYKIKFEYSLVEERHIVTAIRETKRNIKMTCKDFPKNVWQSIQDIGKALDVEIEARGGALVKYIGVSAQSLRHATTSTYKYVEFN